MCFLAFDHSNLPASAIIRQRAVSPPSANFRVVTLARHVERKAAQGGGRRCMEESNREGGTCRFGDRRYTGASQRCCTEY